MKKKILRLTRHAVSEKQLADLRRIFGEVEIVEVSETVPNAERVRELLEEAEAEVLEAVLPLPLLAEVLNPRLGITVPVIRAVMNREVGKDGSATFEFSHYEKILKVLIETECL